MTAVPRFRGTQSIAAAWAAVAALGCGMADRLAAADGCRVAWSCAIPDHPLSAGVGIGGLSDLAVASASADVVTLWTITDRGPNGTTSIDGREARTLVVPEFVPSLVRLRIDHGGREAARAVVTVERVVPLRTSAGGPLSGRPRVADAKNPIVHPTTGEPVPPDPHGVDTEGVAPFADGTFWLAEEYGPSLLHVSADGELLARHVPAGTAAAAADLGTLPADYARRRDNRGFEGLAASPDGARLWAIVQSPLDDDEKKTAKKAGNVRLLAFDPRAGKPVGEYVYRLGNPADPDYLTKGAPPDDGKLGAIAPLADGRLLVIEQDDAGLAHLYAVAVTGATDTLGWRPSADDRAATLEQVVDLRAARLAPVTKTLVADLTALRQAMAAEADGGSGPRHGLLKLEGLAVIGPRHVAIVNDNDFGVHDRDPPGRANRLWVVELDRPLTGR